MSVSTVSIKIQNLKKKKRQQQTLFSFYRQKHTEYYKTIYLLF